MTRLRSMVCLLALIAVAPSQALADKPKLVVAPFGAGRGATDAAAAKFYGLLIDDLRSREESLELIAAPNVSSSRAEEKAPEKPATGKREVPSPDALAALSAGQKAFDELRFEDAVSQLKKGIDGLLSAPASADYQAVADAYVKLAAAAFRMGEEKIAKTALLDLARFSPNYALPADFPPIFHREFDKAKKRLEKQPRGVVTIEGPAGATAFLDGLDLGMVPVNEENVTSGVHYVKVESPQGEKFGQVIQVNGGAVKVKATFGGPVERPAPKSSKAKGPEFVVTGQVDRGTQDRLVNWMKGLGADWALVGYVSKSSETQLTIEAALFSMKKGVFTLMTPVAFDTEVLTANAEAFQLGDEVTKRLDKLEPLATLPLNLTTRAMSVTAQTTSTAASTPDELEMAGPKRRKPVLIPREANASTPLDAAVQTEEPKIEEARVQAPVPTWVWIVTGVAVAAGAGVGGYFGISALTKPVTGTVTATW